ncbi:MAG: thioredoxin domain-containing protein [Patescibacteria group bacterium]|jgi:protein-disulfide isomerase
MSENNKSGMVDNMPPRSAFKLGIFIGIAIVCIIGFFILLAGKFDVKGLVSNNDNKNNANTNVANNLGADTNNGNQPAVININPITKDDWVKGDSKAKISLIEFSDTDCPYCTKFHETVNQLLKDYSGKIKVAYRHFPLPSLHPEAPKKAEAIECVGELGGNDKVWAFMDKLFVTTKPTIAQLPDVVKGLGLDSAKFTECLNSGKYTAKVNDQSQQAQAAGAQGTPYSVILVGDQKIPINGAYPIAEIKTIIDGLLK